MKFTKDDEKDAYKPNISLETTTKPKVEENDTKPVIKQEKIKEDPYTSAHSSKPNNFYLYIKFF
jgi:hypothetical protein